MHTGLKKFTELVTSEDFQKDTRQQRIALLGGGSCRFRSVFALVLRKSVKSIQLVLNEWCRGSSETISASALSQARQKFQHTAFIELLEECVIRPMYEGKGFKRFKGHRLLAIDGSTLHLPTSKELINTFGTVKIAQRTWVQSFQANCQSSLAPEMRARARYGALQKSRIRRKIAEIRLGWYTICVPTEAVVHRGALDADAPHPVSP